MIPCAPPQFARRCRPKQSACGPVAASSRNRRSRRAHRGHGQLPRVGREARVSAQSGASGGGGASFGARACTESSDSICSPDGAGIVDVGNRKRTAPRACASGLDCLAFMLGIELLCWSYRLLPGCYSVSFAAACGRRAGWSAGAFLLSSR